MSTLTESGTKAGHLTYATTRGTHVHLSGKHIVSYTELPDNCLSVITTGNSMKMVFDDSADRIAAMLVLEDALAD